MKIKILLMNLMPVFLALMISCNSTIQWQLESPDKSVRVAIHQLDEKSGTGLYYSLLLKEGDSYKQILDPSPLGSIPA